MSCHMIHHKVEQQKCADNKKPIVCMWLVALFGLRLSNNALHSYNNILNVHIYTYRYYILAYKRVY